MPHQARTRVVELAYAGVVFELVIHGELVFELPAEYAEYVAEPGAHPTAARVTCAVRAQSVERVATPVFNRVELMGGDRGFTLRGDYVSGEVDELSRGHYVATARILPEPMGWAALLRFVSAGAIERVGGLSLHAAGLDLGGQAVLLMGPSGAGKSTACELSPGARCLAYDQVVVYPAGGGYHAWALPWGARTQLPRTAEPVLPIAACVRVTRGTPETRAWAASAVEALFELRQAASANERNLEAEDRRLRALFALSDQVRVGFLSTVLGQRADGALRAWLAGAREVAA